MGKPNLCFGLKLRTSVYSGTTVFVTGNEDELHKLVGNWNESLKTSKMILNPKKSQEMLRENREIGIKGY